jgi:hypothetical protein
MRLGYGVRVKRIRDRDYVDVWRYETRGGRRVQRFEYVGPLEDPGTERKLASLIEKFQGQAMEEFRRMVRAVGAVGGSR